MTKPGDLLNLGDLKPYVPPSASSTHGSYPVCDHALIPVPAFDPEASKDLSASECRRRWPRLEMTCPSCKGWVVKYASREHLVALDD